MLQIDKIVGIILSYDVKSSGKLWLGGGLKQKHQWIEIKAPLSFS